MHNTGNPLPSKDILDLYDNSELIDQFTNSQLNEISDRFGVKRITLAGLIKRSMALRDEINDFSGALTFKPEWTDVPMNVSEGVGGEDGALNLQAEALGNRLSILSSTISFNSILDLKAGINNLGVLIDFEKLPEGVKVTWLGYYTISDGGGNWGVVKNGPHVEDGGRIFSISHNVYIEANIKGKTINPLKFGAKGDGVADDTIPLRNCILNSKVLLVPPGTYRTTATITLQENTTIIGVPGQTIITNDGSFDVFYFAGTRTAHAKNLIITGIKFKATSASDKHLLTGAWFDDVIVTKCSTENCGLINTGVPNGESDHNVYDSITGYDDLSKNIIIDRNIVIGSDTGAAPVGIYMRYISNAIISNNVTNHCGVAGILVWGLDADVNRGKGFPGEPRWTGPVAISCNTGYKNIGSHIFCMGGRNVTVTGNSGMYSIDVGLDMEGCEDCIVSGNTMNNCVNGNYSQFLYQRNVTFIGNVGESTDYPFIMLNKSHRPIRMFLDSHAPENSVSRDIRLINNQFTFTPIGSTPSDLMPIWINRNDSWVIEGNTFVNCRVELLGSNRGASFKNNRFEVKVNPVLNYDLLKLADNGNLSGTGENPVMITGNEFRTTLLGQGGDYRRAMNLDCESFIGYNYIIENNIVIGFGTSLAFKAGGNGNGKVLIRNNTFSGNVLDLTSPAWISLKRSFVYWEHNKTNDGLPYFITLYGKPQNVSVSGFIENLIQPSPYLSVVCGAVGVGVTGPYRSDIGYTLGAFVTHLGKCYRSLISFPNLNNTPDTNPLKWEEIGPESLAAVFFKAGLVDTTPL